MENKSVENSDTDSEKYKLPSEIRVKDRNLVIVLFIVGVFLLILGTIFWSVSSFIERAEEKYHIDREIYYEKTGEEKILEPKRKDNRNKKEYTNKGKKNNKWRR